MKHILVLFIAAASIFSGPLRAQTNASQIIINRLLGLTENPTSTNTSDFADVGQNTILAHGGAFFLINGYSGYSSCLDASSNWLGSSTPTVNNFCFTGTLLTGPVTDIPSFTCGSLFDLVGSKGNVPQSLQNANDSTCTALGASEGLVTDGDYDHAYDSACYYLSHCYYQSIATEGFGALLDAAVDTTLTQIGRTSMKSFLLSVLPLRSDDAWFCDCVNAIGASFFEDTNQNREDMSLSYWLMNNPRCAAYKSGDSAGYAQERKDDYHLWQDTMHYPETYDSSLLTMQQMGLDSVLIIAATEGVQYQPGTSQILLDAHITTNPFSDATNLSLLIGREAYIHIGVYNLLGNQIAGAGIYYGIQTTRYQGYIKLDNINGVGYGWVHTGPLSVPHLVGTQIFNCWGNGILVDRRSILAAYITAAEVPSIWSFLELMIFQVTIKSMIMLGHR